MMKRDRAESANSEARPAYSPHLRTALVLTGTGSAGAYHAGVLRALEEAGIKIDLLAGRGIGVGAAMLGAIGGAHGCGSPTASGSGRWCGVSIAGDWRFASPDSPRCWRCWHWRFRSWWPWQACSRTSSASLSSSLSVETGNALFAASGRLLDTAFRPDALPAWLPRLVTLGVIVLLAASGAAGLTLRAKQISRPERSGWWWDLLGAPWTAVSAVRSFRAATWQLISGGVPLAEPSPPDLSRRYAELLADGLGQPGFRELMAVVHDVDARRDVVFALLAEPQRSRFFPRTGQDAERRGETFDLAGVAREHVVDALAAALSLPVLTDPHLIQLAPEGFWRGETHRLCDRPGATARLLEEVATAGVTQVILVAPFSELRAPYGLSSRRGHLAARAGDYLAAADVSAFDDAVRAFAARFDALFVIRPVHVAIGPFDFAGVLDERSDRHQALPELIDRGYQDAYRQFIDPVVGASGERLAASTHAR